MKILVSSESDALAYESLARLSVDVEQRLNEVLSDSSLAEVDLQIRYVPIVMPPELQARYPARSKALVKSKVLDCSPQLNYSIFADGTSELQFKEYLRGIRTAKEYMPAFAMTAEQIGEFEAILTSLERAG
jgi:hypothetical protein